MKGPPNAHIELKTGSCQSTPRWDLETIRQRKDATSFQGRGNKGWWIRTDSDSSAATLKDRWPQPSKSSKKMISNLEFYMYPTPTCQDRLNTFQTYKFSKIHILSPCLRKCPEHKSEDETKKKEDPEFTQEGGVPEMRGKGAKEESPASGPGGSIFGGFGRHCWNYENIWTFSMTLRADTNKQQI